ncbi:MAG TPA: hypothetical protein VET26_03390 [Candidatus Sulfotelmatobacter sp.]|nr:hypothetical protein [Candidatus Sulfotelmatobacter sp.]
MGRTSARARERAASGPDRLATLVAAWWETVLAGEADEPHPVHGERLVARVNGGTLKLSGEVDSGRDRDELVRQARGMVGRGIDEVDSTGLVVAAGNEERGVLDQVILAAFPNRKTAELALNFVLERGRVAPKRHEIVAPAGAASGSARTVGGVVPDAFTADVRKQVDKGRAVLAIQVDETEAFRVRGLIEEDTRSLWTVAIPPQVAG